MKIIGPTHTGVQLCANKPSQRYSVNRITSFQSTGFNEFSKPEYNFFTESCGLVEYFAKKTSLSGIPCLIDTCPDSMLRLLTKTTKLIANENFAEYIGQHYVEAVSGIMNIFFLFFVRSCSDSNTFKTDSTNILNNANRHSLPVDLEVMQDV